MEKSLHSALVVEQQKSSSACLAELPAS